MKIKAFAKVNLALAVLGKRPDGYHNIESIMQSVSLYDEIELQKSEAGISLDCSDDNIKREENLCYKAAKIFIEKAAQKGIILGCGIKVQKKIPVAAGLGGGSVDAAAVLVGLNELADKIFCYDELCSMALQLGADVPFCIKGGTALAKGIGEELTELLPLPDCFIVVSKKGIKSSTGDMYRKLDSLKNPKLPKINSILKGIESGNLESSFFGAYNSFEQACDEAVAVRDALDDLPFVYCGLSGAGPSVISVFKTEQDAETAENRLKSMGHEAFSTVPVNSANQIIE